MFLNTPYIRIVQNANHPQKGEVKRFGNARSLKPNITQDNNEYPRYGSINIISGFNPNASPR
jgi:hypothetical protein